MPRRPRNQLDRRILAQVEEHLTARDEKRPKWRKLKLELTNKAKADSGPAVLRIYDAIGGWFGITATDVAERLDDLDDDRDLVVRVNSPGGDVFDGTAIFNLLATWQGNVDVVVDGLAASAASFICQAGDTITMNRGTQMMIHDAHGFTIGNASDHRMMADLLDGVSDEIAGIYAARAGKTREEWREEMRAECWYNAEAAVEAGLADSTADAEDQDEEEGEKAAASWGLRPTARRQPAVAASHGSLATGANQPAPIGEPEDQVQPIEDVDPEVFAGMGEWLDDVFDEMAGYNAELVGSLIRDVYDDAPATPTVDSGPPRERAVIPIDEFVNELVQGLQEGVRP